LLYSQVDFFDIFVVTSFSDAVAVVAMTVSRFLLKSILGKKKATNVVTPKSELVVSNFPPVRERVLDVPKIRILVAG
jgi:hypothetical protein